MDIFEYNKKEYKVNGINSKPAVVIVKFTPLTLRKQYDDGDYALLSWSTRGAYPRITVFTSNKVKTESFDYGRMIIAKFDYNMMNSFLSSFETVIDGPVDNKVQFNCFDNKFVNNQRTDEIELISTITIGKNKEGIIFLAVTAEGKKKVAFELTMQKWHTVSVNGEPLTDPASLSKLMAKGYLRTAKKLLGYQLVNDTMKPETPAVTKPTNNADLSSITEDDLF